MMKFCPDCMADVDELKEGYCHDCHKRRQMELDLFNAEYDAWQKLSDEQKEQRIRFRMFHG